MTARDAYRELMQQLDTETVYRIATCPQMAGVARLAAAEAVAALESAFGPNWLAEINLMQSGGIVDAP